MALQLHKIQAFSPRPPSSYLQVHYSSLPVPQKVFMLSVVFLLLDSFSQYLTNGDIRYWEKLSNAFTAVLPLSKFFASRQKNDEILTKSSHFGKAWYFCRGPPDCRCPQTIHPLTIAGGQLCSIHELIFR